MSSNWIEGEHYYYNEAGLIVLTGRFHLERGYCCGNGCRHCPFDFVNVPEPKRSELKKEAAMKNSNHDSNE